MSAEIGKHLMNVYLNDVLGNRNYSRIPEIAAPGMVDHTQPGKSGPDALDAHARGFCENTPDVKIDVLSVSSDDKTAIGIWRWQGDPHHPSAVSAKGSPVVPRIICSVFNFEDEKIQEYRVFVDAVDVFTQLAQ